MYSVKVSTLFLHGFQNLNNAGGIQMKRLFLILAVTVILIPNIFANQSDPRTPLSLRDFSTKPLIQNNRFAPTYNFVINPLTIGNNYYDYFPGSYNSKPMQRVQTPNLNGHWLVYHAKPTISSNRRVYKTFIDNTGTIQDNQAFGIDDIWEGYAGMDVTAGGRPILAYHADLDGESTALEVGFGYDAVIAGLALGMNSDLLTVIDNPVEINVNGVNVPSNEFIWPSVQIGDSPIAGSQRVYILGKNATDNGVAIAENVIIYYKDFIETDIEYQMFDGSGWESTSIPQLNEWNVSDSEWRRPYMSFIVHEDKVYYIGYHISYTNGSSETPIDEASLTVFVCDNYGEGTWTQHSTYGDFSAINPPFINPYTGEEIEGEHYYEDLTDDMLSNKMGQSGHFSTAMDNEGRIHFPGFYTLSTSTGSYFPDCHTIKNIMFNTSTLAWTIAEVYPQQENGSQPFIPNDPIDITQYTTTNKYLAEDLWQWWDKDGDGEIDEVLDDGSYDGVNDWIAPEDTDYWGMPVLTTIWPFMYWDQNAADNAMQFHLHAAHISNANEQGMMAMVWQDASKSRLYNLYPDSYPEYIFYQNMCEIVISVSADNGNHWSEPIFLNGVDTTEMEDEIPEFPYIGSQVDYIGQDEFDNPIGRVHLMYLDDNTYGSSVQNIGQSTGGEMKYMAIDVNFVNSQPDDFPTLALPESFIFEEDGELIIDINQYVNNEDNIFLNLSAGNTENISVDIDELIVSFSANQDWNGTERLTFTISNRSNTGGRFTSSGTVDIIVTPVNDAPTIELPESFMVPGNGELLVDMSQYVDDVDGDNLNLSISGNQNIFVTIDQLMVTFIPTADWYGSNQITCTVSDNSDRISSGLVASNSNSSNLKQKVRNNSRLIASATTVLNVIEVNNPPTIELPDSFTFEENGLLIVDMSEYVNDVDGDPLSLSVSGNANILVSINELIVTLSAQTDWYGTNLITFIVDDGIARASSGFSTSHSKSRNKSETELNISRETSSATTTIIVTSVNETPTIDLPDSFTFNEDESLLLDMNQYVEDLDGDVLTLTVTDNENITTLIESMNITFGALANWYGTEEITITANDGRNRAIASGTSNIIVLPVNDSPEIISFTPTETEINALLNTILDFSVEAEDIDSELTYSWFINNQEQVGDTAQFSYQFIESLIFEVKVVVADEDNSLEQVWSVTVPVHNDDSLVTPLITGIVSNYPNPFNPDTTIQYSLKEAGKVSITIYDLAGKLVKRVYSGYKQAGTYSNSWNGLNSRNQGVASGVYYVRMQSGRNYDTRKIMLMK